MASVAHSTSSAKKAVMEQKPPCPPTNGTPCALRSPAPGSTSSSTASHCSRSRMRPSRRLAWWACGPKPIASPFSAASPTVSDDSGFERGAAVMTLRLHSYIERPANRSKGGFDHADIHLPSGRLYVAHTANDAVDVIDIRRDEYIESIDGLTGVAGALVSEERGLVFTSNRGEN